MVCAIVKSSQKILIWSWGRKGGGAQYSKEIANEFVKMDRECIYLSFSKESDVIDSITKMTENAFHAHTYSNKIEFMVRTVLLPFLIIDFIVFLKRNNIHTIYTPMMHTWTIFFIPFFKLFKIKHVLTIHDVSMHPGDCKIFNLINKVLFKSVELIVVLSAFVKKELIQNYAIDENIIIESKHGLFNYNKMNFSYKQFTENKTLRIVFFGRILEYKGLHHLIEAIAILEKENLDIGLEIYGSGSIKKYQEGLDKIKSLKLENRWINNDEIFEIFDKACLNICPYIEASQSGVIPIALGCGIPSIVTDLGALSEQVKNNETGIVIDPNNITLSLVDAIRRLYLDRRLCNQFSKSAYEYAQENLQWGNIARELKKSIEEKI